MDEVVLTGARVLNGLLAGIYLAFLVAVMPALHGQADDVYVSVMNRINVVIVNPVFLTAFLGAPALAGATMWSHRNLTVAAAITAAAGSLLITVLANVPLNNALAANKNREAFQTPWLIWHAIRTTSATAALVLLCLPAATR